jgi:hypothetical protein
LQKSGPSATKSEKTSRRGRPLQVSPQKLAENMDWCKEIAKNCVLSASVLGIEFGRGTAFVGSRRPFEDFSLRNLG